MILLVPGVSATACRIPHGILRQPASRTGARRIISAIGPIAVSQRHG